MMSQHRPAQTPSPVGFEQRIHLSQHIFELDDGHRVGVSVGGHGVPLVFLHGLALNHRAYLETLHRIADLGFLVVAIDAAGHGATQDFGARAHFADFVSLTLRALDVLGIEMAVFAGHSMGGRMVIELAAQAPERVLAAILFNAAAGASFDQMLEAASGPLPHSAAVILAILLGNGQDPAQVSMHRFRQLLRILLRAVIRNLRCPLGPARAALAMVQSPNSTALLRVMRERAIPTLVLHGDHDALVSFQTARDMAQDAGGSLYRLQGACHSWILANPRQGADALRHLITGELGEALRRAAQLLGIPDWRNSALWEQALIEPTGLIRRLGG